jgi:hypothetical protein
MLFLTISIICIPFLLILLWKNKRIGVAVMVPAVVLSYIGIGLVLQTLHLFTHTIVLSVHGVVAVGVLVFLYTRRNQIREYAPQRISLLPTLLLLCAFSIVFYQLYAVHFSYTGVVATVSEEEQVADSSYPYPLYSDEWISIAMAKTMIAEQTLPFVHPFTGAPYNNFLFIFQVLIAQLSILVGGTLTTTYVWLGIIINMLVVCMMCVWWRAQGISAGIAAFGILLVPYIANSSNLPMLWYLLPWNVGFLLLLCGYVLMVYNQKWLAVGACVVSVLVYPPYIIFIIPIVLVFTRALVDAAHRRIMYLLTGFCITAPLVFITAVSLTTTLSFGAVTQQFFDILIRPLNSSAGLPPTFLLWHIIPFIVIPFAIYAAYTFRKELAVLLVPISIGLVWWTLNGLADVTVFIDYHRVVSLTSLLIFMLSMHGVQAFWKELSGEFSFLKSAHVQIISCTILLIFFLVLVPTYTARQGWRAFVTKVRDAAGVEHVYAPASPVNRYVHPDDLRIFEKLSGERFLSVGWKGLVLGTLTNNEPVFTKPSTITVNTVPYARFVEASCDEKKSMLQKARVSYVYIPRIECDGFEIVDKSAEELYLMRVVSL